MSSVHKYKRDKSEESSKPLFDVENVAQKRENVIALGDPLFTPHAKQHSSTNKMIL